MQFRGYRRADGRVGVRNHTALVCTVYCAATVARGIAEATGLVLISYEGGCVELGPQAEHTERALRGVIRHPNVGAVLVLGLGCEQMAAASLAAEAAGKPVRHFNIQDVGGMTAAVEKGRRLGRELIVEASQFRRKPAELSELTLATQCGGSDTGSGLASNPAVGVLADRLVGLGGTVLLGETGSLYGAAGVLAERAATPEVARRIVEITDVMERHFSLMGRSLKEANPTPGNIAGGLTTLVEKSLGGVRKGGTSTIQGVLEPAESVPPGSKGLWIMDTTMGVDVHGTSDMVAGGAQIVAFTTGRGNPVGSPIAPVIKITASQRTVQTMGEIIDFDTSPVLLGMEGLEDCGQRLFDEFVAVANGKPTKAEQLGHTLFGIGRVPIA